MAISYRVEPGRLVLFDAQGVERASFSSEMLDRFARAVATGNSPTDPSTFFNLTITSSSDREALHAWLHNAVLETAQAQAPLRSLSSPQLIHVELTTKCPLRCPQCYANLEQGRELSYEFLKDFLSEAAQLKVVHIALSGGEPLLYPQLTEVVAQIHQLGMHSTISTSGCGLTRNRLQELLAVGLGPIWVSINGSNEAVHHRSRDKFSDAIRALELLAEAKASYGINWVARKDNAVDFPQVVALAREMRVGYINILLAKPDAKDDVDSFLAGQEFLDLATYIQQYQGKTPVIGVESCYSYLRSYLGWNCMSGIDAGCPAGRRLMALDVQGRYLPCRHLPYGEKWSSIREYWFGSETLTKLRTTEEHVGEPCCNCARLTSCRTCRKTCLTLSGSFYAGQEQCPVQKIDAFGTDGI